MVYRLASHTCLLRTVLALLFVANIMSIAIGQTSGGQIDTGPEPNYYSGTNCVASGFESGYGPVAHSFLILECNGVSTVVKEMIPDDEELPLSTALYAVFDSSHFHQALPSL